MATGRHDRLQLESSPDIATSHIGRARGLLRGAREEKTEYRLSGHPVFTTFRPACLAE